MPSAFCTHGRKGLLDAVVQHNWKAALYVADAKLNGGTRAYSPINEVVNGKGYRTGGVTLNGATTGMSNGLTAWLTFDDITWPDASFTARYLLIYDASDDNRAYAVIDFGADKTGQGGNFTFKMPPADAKNALIRV